MATATANKPTIKKLENGKWQVRQYINRDRGYLRRQATTRAEAERIAKMLVENSREEKSLAGLLTSYLKDMAATKSPKTVAQKTSVLNRFVAFVGGDRRPKSITVERLTDYRDRLAKSLVSSTIAGNLRTISAFCTWLVDRGHLADNPCQRVQKPSARPVKSKTVLEPEQVDAILRDDACPLSVRLLMVTGMRPEELQGLRWDCVHESEPTPYLTIERVAYYAPGDGWKVREGAKNTTSLRRVVIDAATAAILRDRRPSATSKSYVVGHNNGKDILTADRLDSIVKNYFAAQGVGNMTPYTLRRSCVTYLLGMGVDAKTVAQRVGHSNIQTTLQAYAQVTSAQATAAAGLFNR